MDVILTEKPSVAREIAAFVGARTRHDGYLEGSAYHITWAYGHLAELKEPHDYDPALKRWSLESLPLIPSQFELKLTKDARSRQQFDVIKRLFESAERIICATDAGREGELIFRYILSMTGCKRKPLSRLRLSSLTPAAIREALGRLRPGSDYDRLYAAASLLPLKSTWTFSVRIVAVRRLRPGRSFVFTAEALPWVLPPEASAGFQLTKAVHPLRDVWRAETIDQEKLKATLEEIEPKLRELEALAAEYEAKIYAAAKPIPRKYEIVRIAD